MSVLPCESVPTGLGDFPKDWRVNYAYGMVMGVDDFRQEQAYHLGRKRLNNQALHGYGVAWGLDVVVQAGSDGPEVVVKAGMAVGVGGEDLCLSEDYCLKLDDWLEGLSDEDRTRLPASGPVRLCVTLSYDECLERLVPVPGLPCAVEEDNRAYSRIRDAFDLRLDFDPPVQEGEAASRRFGAVLSRVDVDASPSGSSDEEALIDAIREIKDLVGTGTPVTDPTGAEDPFRIPLADVPRVLRRAYRVWSAEVRPALVDEDDRRILLACLDFELRTTAAGDLVIVNGAATVDPDGRPVLLNTRAIQELFFAGGWLWSRESLEFATLHVDAPDRIRAWVHHPDPLKVPATGAVEVEVNHVKDPSPNVSPVGSIPNLYEITPGREIPEDAHVTVRFNVDAIKEADPPGRTLREVVDEGRLHYVSRRDEWIFAHTVFQGVVPSRRFVTVRYVHPRRVELWLHTDEKVGFRVSGDPPVRFFRGGREVTDFKMFPDPATEQDDRAHLWFLELGRAGAQREPNFEDGERLELRFDATGVWHDPDTTRNAQLRTWIRDTETDFLGWDGDERIDTFHLLVVHPDLVRTRPTVLFARLCPVEPYVLRMWLHGKPLKLEGLTAQEGPLTLRLDGAVLEKWRLVRAPGTAPDENVFDLHLASGPVLARNGARIEVEFHPDAMPLGDGGRLGQILERLDWRYLNQVGRSIFAWHLHCCCEDRTCHFVSGITLKKQEALLWFHTPEPVRLRDVTFRREGGGFTGEEGFRLVPGPGGPAGFARAWRLEVPADAPLSEKELLTLEFPVEKVNHGDDDITLLDHMVRDRVKYVCYDGTRAIRAFIPVHLPPPPPPPPPEEEEPPRIDRDEILELFDERLELFRTTDFRPAVLEVFDVDVREEIEGSARTAATEAALEAARDTAASAAATAVEARVGAEFRVEIETAARNAARTAAVDAARSAAESVAAEVSERARTVAVTEAKAAAARFLEENASVVLRDAAPDVMRRPEFIRALIEEPTFTETFVGRADLLDAVAGRVRDINQ